jgi:hypothetical protein
MVAAKAGNRCYLFARANTRLSTPMMKPATTDPEKALMLALWRDRDAIPIPIPGSWPKYLFVCDRFVWNQCNCVSGGTF